MRGKRFALYAEDGVVRKLNVEAPGEFKISDAKTMLEAIG
jgi:peroxiredoxin